MLHGNDRRQTTHRAKDLTFQSAKKQIGLLRFLWTVEK